MEQEQSKRDCARARKHKQRKHPHRCFPISYLPIKVAASLTLLHRRQGIHYSVYLGVLRCAQHLKLVKRTLCHLYRYRCTELARSSTYTLHVDIYLHISGYFSARDILCACVFLVYSCFCAFWLCIY